MNDLERVQQHLAAVVEDSHDAIITKNLDSIILSWNRGAERLFGYTAEEAIGQSVMIIFPDDAHHEEAEFIERLRRGERIAHFETTRRRKDGSLVPISLTVSPVRDAGGRIIGASKIARDITLQHQAVEQQRLLLSEMRHRVGNCFAVASGLLSICARQADSTDDLVQEMQERFRALSTAHSLAVRDPDPKGASAAPMHLSDLIKTVLEPFIGEKAPQLEIEDCPVVDSAITPLALVLYELCTNAVKYGGLSQPEGALLITSETDSDRLRIIWHETFENDAPDDLEAQEGFGSQMCESTISGYLNGTFQQ